MSGGISIGAAVGIGALAFFALKGIASMEWCSKCSAPQAAVTTFTADGDQDFAVRPQTRICIEIDGKLFVAGEVVDACP